MRFPLMRNNFDREDLDLLIQHLSAEDPILTNGPNCLEFEREWSEWLGVKHSVFVNSGSSANLLSMTLLRMRYPEGGEVIVPPLTWVSDVSSVLQAGFSPVFADINARTLSLDTDSALNKITDKTRAIFLTHAQGFNGLTDRLLDELKRLKIDLIEDVCESHGACHRGLKLGSFGLMSNFSFYYAHHMSTIEGGMICTNDEDIYETLRMLRSHGMVREACNESTKAAFIKKNPDLNPSFIFAFPAFNMRNNEMGGILGRSQLKKLDANNIKRTKNQSIFFSNINQKRFQTDFLFEGSSNYAFNLVLKEPDQGFMTKLMSRLDAEGVEYRRGSAGGGNQLRQPYLKNIVPKDYYKNFPVTEHVHFYGMYIGNFPSLTEAEILEIAKIINSVG
jgi:CDP-6-deoxy-D-xylo-4-hexulose-3-dehydrase